MIVIDNEYIVVVNEFQESVNKFVFFYVYKYSAHSLPRSFAPSNTHLKDSRYMTYK